MRDRLVELLNKKYDHFCDQCGVNKDSHYTDSLADYLLANGVIVPPCNLGDTLYVAFKESSGKVEEIHIEGIEMCRYDNQPDFVLFVCVAKVTTGKRKGEKIKFAGSCFDRKEVCFSKEEAEQALRKEDEGK